jgi:transcriptional activator of cad operon
MERLPTTKLCVGDWCVNPASGEIWRNGETERLEVRAMRLLVCLAERAGEVVSIDELLDQVWSEVAVSQDSVYQAVTSLRRVLGDDAKQPTYIETVPRLGYRMVAKVSPWEDEPSAQTESSLGLTSRDWPKVNFKWAAVVAACLAIAIAAVVYGKIANHKRIDSSTVAASVDSQSERSIVVLPFLDLTEGMNEEPFADGMTEELIDKLSKIPGLRVPPPTSSFYFKGKQIPVSEIARSLGVAYVLDGSVRKSSGRLRVSARLVRAETGFVVWTETYDRPFDDILMVQDEIAGKVTKELNESIGGGGERNTAH